MKHLRTTFLLTIVCLLAFLCWERLKNHPEKYALLIGVDSAAKLRKAVSYPAAETDPQIIANTLVQEAGFSRDNIRVLTLQSRDKPTQREIIRQLEKLVRDVDVNDEVLLYFVGHGFRQGNEDYYIPDGVNWDDPAQFRKTIISARQVASYADQMKAANVMTFYEKCRVGEQQQQFLRDAHGVERFLIDERQYQLPTISPAFQYQKPVQTKLSSKTRVTIYSCAPDQSSFTYNNAQRGYFSSFLEQGLKGCAAGSDGIVTVGSLLTYLRSAVFANVRLNISQSQVPFAVVNEGDMNQVKNIVLTKKMLSHSMSSHSTEKNCVSIENNRSAFSKKMLDGYIAYIRGDSKQALSLFNQATRLSSSDSRPWYEQARLLRDEKDLKGAQQVMTDFVAQLKPDPLNDYEVGRLLQSQGYVTQAEFLYQRSLKKEPRSPGTYLMLGFLEANRHNSVKAENYYRRSLALSSKWSEPYFYLARLLANQRKYQQAEQLYTRAMKIDPENVEHLYEVAYFLQYNRKKYTEAEKIFRRLTEIEANSPVPYVYLANCLWAQKKFAQAQSQIKKANSLGLKTHPIYSNPEIKGMH